MTVKKAFNIWKKECRYHPCHMGYLCKFGGLIGGPGTLCFSGCSNEKHKDIRPYGKSCPSFCEEFSVDREEKLFSIFYSLYQYDAEIFNEKYNINPWDEKYIVTDEDNQPLFRCGDCVKFKVDGKTRKGIVRGIYNSHKKNRKRKVVYSYEIEVNKGILETVVDEKLLSDGREYEKELVGNLDVGTIFYWWNPLEGKERSAYVVDQSPVENITTVFDELEGYKEVKKDVPSTTIVFIDK